MKAIITLLAAFALCGFLIALCMYRNAPTPENDPTNVQLEYMFWCGANAEGDMDSCLTEALLTCPVDVINPAQRKGWWYGRNRTDYN